MNGIIIKGVGGLYCVRITDGAECGRDVFARARGIFRKEQIVPAVGDTVTLSRISENTHIDFLEVDEEKGRRKGQINKADVEFVIEEIGERRNSLIRPAMANLDYLFAVIPCMSPEPDLLTVDKLTAIAENSGIEPVIIVNKSDLNPSKSEEIADVYRLAGYEVFRVSGETGEGTDELKAFIDRTAEKAGTDGIFVSGAFAGVSGAGKSTLMTRLFPTLDLKSGEVSRKTERGKHTTRYVELYPAVCENGTFWIADTPGFSMLDFNRFNFFPYDNLPSAFREFDDCLGNCKFTKCTHLCEDGCAVIEKMNGGFIAKSRHESYKRIFEEQRSVPEWKRRQEQKPLW